MSIQKGDQAPNFKLLSSEKNEIQLSDYKGKNLLLLFFPQAFTGVCTAELCAVRDNYSMYENMNVDVLGISVDSVFTLEEFKKQQGYNFTLLSDFNKDVSRSYGSIYEDWVLGMKGVSMRSAFVVDKDGTVQYAEVLDDVMQQPDFSAIKETLESL